MSNARYAINASNARWGSLYDALYGTDVISEEEGAEKGKGYNPTRGAKVIAYAKAFLDKAAPLTEGKHAEVVKYEITDNGLQATLTNGNIVGLQNPEKCIGYNGGKLAPSAILLKNNDLHIEIQIDKDSPIGKTDIATVKDIVLESAVTTIMDCEDSVAAVDADDKVEVYTNWLGLIKGEVCYNKR